ncbi:MAG: hypothetical protein R3C29_10885 [Dehalococcoidia bacterium]|nr:hypothetical protein [Dehalococcoidia bacterium]
MDATIGRHVRTWLPWIGGGIGAAWALSMLWWALLEPAQARASEAELIIPEGTAAAVAQGAPAPFIPNSIELARNGDLTVINRDTQPHEVGSWTIPPGGRAVISAATEDGQFTCTIHPGGILGFSIDKRPSILTTLYAAFILGLPTGFVFGLASVITRRLDTG